MSRLNFPAILMAALAAFVASSVYYMALGKELAKVSPNFAAGRPAPWKMLVVVAQSLVLATILDYLLARIGIGSWLGAGKVAVLLWLGLSAAQWVSSMVFEKVPPKMAAIHGGDWLLKLVLISIIVGTWHRGLGS